MTTATLESVKILPYIPARGQRFLSVNLALVDLVEITEFAREMGLKPELVQMPAKSGIQIHALLWQGAIADTPTEMNTWVDALADRVNPDAIRYATGAWTQPPTFTSEQPGDRLPA
jgi:hypothetical protein